MLHLNRRTRLRETDTARRCGVIRVIPRRVPVRLQCDAAGRWSCERREVASSRRACVRVPKQERFPGVQLVTPKRVARRRRVGGRAPDIPASNSPPSHLLKRCDVSPVAVLAQSRSGQLGLLQERFGTTLASRYTARATMLRLKPRQRELFIEKMPDVANIAAASFCSDSSLVTNRFRCPWV